ncbi:uncharacterized protein LOC134745969 [Cydia strobilella]|uniref:uncharacterized protein LOC134745969 n=1 Tax=Cydia strobilella TaxID=1100964 RepID=UPI0030078284
MAHTLKCNNCNIVVNELLAFVINKLHVMDDESMSRICLAFFTAQDIRTAKDLLFLSVPVRKRKINRRREGHQRRDIDDIIDLARETDPDKFPVFVAKDLHKLPPIDFDSVDLTSLLKDMVVLKNELQTIKARYVTQEQFENLEKTAMECRRISNESDPFYRNVSHSNLNVNVRRGAYLNSGPMGLHISSSIENADEHNKTVLVCFNNISYADDMVLLSPSVGGLRLLIERCESYALTHNLKYNVSKSEYMVFKAGSKCPSHVPPIRLNGVELKRVSSFKYLGHLVTDDFRDDADIERERRALAVRANMIARRFSRCTAQVKLTLFRAFCTSLYTCSLWTRYTQRAFNAMRVQYNDAFRVLLRLPRYCSASGMFADAHVDGFHATLRKRCAATLRRVRDSRHSLLTVVADRWDSGLIRHWSSLHLSLAPKIVV